MFNMDKPNKNGRYYSREVIYDGSIKFCEEYLYLYDRMPTNEENTLPPENIIGNCLETYWSNNDSQLLNVFQLREDKTKDIDFTKMYPAMFGTGNMNTDEIVTEFYNEKEGKTVNENSRENINNSEEENLEEISNNTSDEKIKDEDNKKEEIIEDVQRSDSDVVE